MSPTRIVLANVAALARPGVLVLAAALTVAAIVGKQVCSLGVLGRGVDRFVIGIGMIPRGEVGLIFANIGLGLVVGGERIVDPSTFSNRSAGPPDLTARSAISAISSRGDTRSRIRRSSPSSTPMTSGAS